LRYVHKVTTSIYCHYAPHVYLYVDKLRQYCQEMWLPINSKLLLLFIVLSIRMWVAIDIAHMLISILCITG